MAQAANAGIPRPASGIGLEPGRMIEWMNVRALGFPDVARLITGRRLLPLRHTRGRSGARPWSGEPHDVVPSRDRKTCTACGRPVAAITTDGVTKIANGQRNPRAPTLRAICAVLDIDRAALLPGAPPPDLEAEARRQADRDAARREQEEHEAAMTAFADALGRPELYADRLGRRRISAELRRLYAEYQASREAVLAS